MQNKATKKLGDIAEFINGGAWNQTEYTDSGIPVVRVSDIHDSTVSLSGCKYLPQSAYAKYAKHELREGDLVICTVGSHPTQPNSVVGRPGIMSKSCEGALLNQNAVCVRPLNELLDKTWLGYFARSRVMKDYIIAHARGSANQVRVAIGSLKDMDVLLPSIEEQKKGADVLVAYDRLIESNTRRIKIIEEMALAIYREWFVKFRFPGHEKVKMTDSPLGPIPEEWEVKTIADTFQILGGGTPSKKVSEYWDGGTVTWYAPTDLTSSGSMFMEQSGTQISDLGLKKSSAKLFPAFSVMMTSRATLGVISINTTEAATNQGFITCIPNERFPLYTLFHWLKENVKYFVSLGTGATFKEITKGVFKTIELAIPQRDVTDQFEELVGPLAQQALNFQKRNRILRQTRDLLLPRLISGELDVSDLNIETSTEAA